ncbi:MAG: BPTI/Kunitz domain-containing protein [Bacteroidota bacterium]|nr:BPTI/Kunitz domain-containing protein [Bacteroidota bacterium]
MIRIGLLLLLLWSSVLGAAQVEACLLEPDPGPCEAAIPAWHFDPLTQMCTEFTWGGCEGVVPFATLAACQASGCVGDTLSYPICDSISVTALSFGTWPSGVDHLAILVEPFFTSMVWVAYCGFALSDSNGHLIAAETNETAPNFYGFGSAPGYFEERFLDLEPGVDLQGSPPPFPWTLRLFEGWMAGGGGDLVCEWSWTELDLASDVRPILPTAQEAQPIYFDVLGRAVSPEPGRLLIRRSPNGAVSKVWISE